MRREQNRDPSYELFEGRIVLSANCTDSDCVAVRAGGVVDDARVTEHAFIAVDNSTLTARDLGTLDGPRQFTDEYVGRYDDRDVFRFELETESFVSVQLSGMTADADLYLLDTNEHTVLESKNWGAESESFASVLDAGEYFVVVENYHFLSATTYVLDLQSDVGAGPDLAGNTFAESLDLGIVTEQQQASDYVGPIDTVDFYQFQLEERSSTQILLTGQTADLDLFLYSSDQNQLDKSDSTGVVEENIGTVLEPGTYYLLVTPFGADGSDYDLEVVAAAVEEPAGEPPDVPEEPLTDPPSDDPIDTSPLVDVDYFGGSREWGLNAIAAPEAWAAGYTGEGITVAIIDTGVQLDHPDLLHSIWVNAGEIAGDGIDNDGNGFIDDQHGWDFVDTDNSPDDEHNHGTHVAGIVTAARNDIGGTGVAYASQIMPIRVLNDQGTGSTFDVAQGIRYAVDNGAHVINLSLGGGRSTSILSAVRYALDNNVFVVAASGNEGEDVPGYPGFESGVYENLISVGAHNNSNQLASFSNRVGDSKAIQVDAPGVTIYSTLTNSNYSYLSGTSMATPYVSGLAALILSANPDLTAPQLRAAITAGAVNTISGSDSIGGINAAHSIPLGMDAQALVVTSQVPPTETDSELSSTRVYATIARQERVRLIQPVVVDELAPSLPETATDFVLDELAAFLQDLYTEPADDLDLAIATDEYDVAAVVSELVKPVAAI